MNILRDKKGQSLVIVICLMAVFVALSLAVILSSTELTAGQQLDLYREQARIGAVTLMHKAEDELRYRDEADLGKKSSIQAYLVANMSVFAGINGENSGALWSYYDEDDDTRHPRLIRTFKLEGTLEDGMRIENATIDMYWTADSGVMEDKLLPLETKCQSTKLIVTVNCTAGGETYSIQQAFDTIYSAPLDGGEASIYWAFKEVAE